MQLLQASRPDSVVKNGGRAIGSITYRSRANRNPTWNELDDLTRTAQQRNRSAGLTGMLLYEDGRFFQTIEGPPDSLDRVWSSIQADARHRELDVLSMGIIPIRMFDGWDMRWMRKGGQADLEHETSRGLSFLEPVTPSERLAQFVLHADAQSFAAELDRLHPGASLATLLDYVLEPAARALGDAWMRDDLDSATMMLALGRFNLAIHQRRRRDDTPPAIDKHLLAITLPGEPHVFGAVAAAELHRSAGWGVDLEFPKTTAQMLSLVATTEYDHIDVATSDALNRSDVRARAPQLASLIQGASRNPQATLSFGGRAFWADGARCDLPGCMFRSSAAGFRHLKLPTAGALSALARASYSFNAQLGGRVLSV